MKNLLIWIILLFEVVLLLKTVSMYGSECKEIKNNLKTSCIIECDNVNLNKI